MIRKNIRKVKGDDIIINEIYNEILPQGDYYFTAKLTSEFLDSNGNVHPRVIDVKGSIEILENGKTSLTFLIHKSVTNTLTQNYLYYDIVNLYGGIETTIQTGLFILDQDIRTPLDGFPLPENNIKVVTIDTDSFNVNDMLIVKMIDGEKKFVPITLAELKDLLNNV